MASLTSLGSDWIWRRGPISAAVFIGVPAGAIYGLLRFASGEPASRSVSGGVVFVLFGAAMSVVVRRRWRQATELAPSDRVAVVRAVRKGEDIGDDRLASAVVDYAQVVRTAQERDARHSWVLVVFAGLSALLALAAAVGGATREALVYGAMGTVWVVAIRWLSPRQRARWMTRARTAEEAARRRLPNA